MTEINTSLYKDAVADNPLDVAGKVVDYRNKLLQNVQQQQAVQANDIKLATERFGAINNAASGIMSDPDLGSKDVTSKLWETLGRLTKGDTMTAQHAVQFMQQFPSDPRQQKQAIQNVYSQTLGPWERGKAWLGENTPVEVGGGKKFIQQPAFGSGGPQDRGFIPNTLQPGTTKVNPDLSQSYVGEEGNPGIVPASNGAPARPKVQSSPTVVGDDEGVRSGIYPAPQSAKPVLAAPSPGEAEAAKGSAEAYNSARDSAGKYANRVNPLRQAIPLLEKMKPEDVGGFNERINDFKQAAVSLGVGKLAGIDPEKIANYNELKKYFTQYAAQAAATLGPKTNDGLATAVTSNPNVHMDKLSATDLSKVALGIERMQQAGVKEFQEAVRAKKAKPGDFGDFMVDWATKQDPRAFVYDLLDKKGQDAVRKLSDAEKAKIRSGMALAEKHGLIGDVHRE